MATSIGSEGLVLNPASTNIPDGTFQAPNQDRQGAAINADLKGKFSNAAYRKALFSFNVTAVTVPVIANNLVSVFTLWNPPSSGVYGELVDAEVGQVLATTVVDTMGWYFSNGSKALAGTFTTASVANTNHFSGRIGDVPNNNIIPYTAYTHSGTPVRVDMVTMFGATTDASMAAPSKFYDGRLLLPPGTAISLAMTTAAGTTSGLDLGCRWIEWPL
jgi:hypothetical protein